MSLINDALKRAKTAQPAAAAMADGPALRPDFSPRRSHAGNDFLLPALVVVILALAIILLWQWFRSGHSETAVHARTIETAQPAPPTVVAPAQIPAPQTVVVNPQPPFAPAAQPAVAVPIPPQPAPSNAQPVVVAPAQPVVPPPPAFKLQSIFYRAKSPSAVINGKTLYIGDRVGTAHVVAITQESATIVTADGETKVLELP